MEHCFEIGAHKVSSRRDPQEKAFIVNSLPFIGESDASFYLPFQDGILIQDTEAQLLWLAQHYQELRKKAFGQIGKTALAGNFWGKKLAEAPQLDLVWARVTNIHSQGWALAFNNAKHDAYTLWVVSFEELTFKQVSRQAW